MTDAEDELEVLFRAEYRGLVRALAVVAGDAESAADAVQDAFVQAHRHWPRIRRYDQPALWVRRTAVNRIMNQHRSRRRRDAAVERLPVPPESVARDLDVGPAVAALPKQQRMAISLHYLADLPVAEVAAAMKVAPGTVLGARPADGCPGKPTQGWGRDSLGVVGGARPVSVTSVKGLGRDRSPVPARNERS